MSEYTPSDKVVAGVAAVEAAEEALKQRRQELREAVAADLLANPEVTNKVVADKLPFTEEYVRKIARDFDVPRKRQPTVRSIKNTKRTGR
ncbi:OTU domain-containing protein [Streptomyces cadmiisoli]|uniref:hypothetical protein n=1 Tax=Streptomyces cadmiisoli TaxID=2184053 RepID=UPI00364D1F53